MLQKIYKHFVDPKFKFAAASLAARGDGFHAFVVPGSNMAPTLEAGEVAWYEKIEKCGPLKRGSVVAFRHEQFGEHTIPSRVIGLAGESVRLHDGDLYVNDVRIPEPYLQSERCEQDYSRELAPVLVPPESLWLMGDFRDMSKDSRHLGAIPVACLQGVVVRGHALGEHTSPRSVR